MPPADDSWNFLSYSSKDRMLAVMRHEYEVLLDLVSGPDVWERSTACEGWQVRDMVGHLVDATDGFLEGFDAARQDREIAPVGFEQIAVEYDRAARVFRDVARTELLARFRDDTERLFAEFEALSSDDWFGLIVQDRYAGPLPALAIVAALLGGYTVHGWDLRQGAGMPHAMSADAADLLVPFVFALLAVTANTESVEQPFAIGIRTTGRNAGDTRADVSRDGVRFEAAAIDDCDAILEVDPGTLVLTAYGRVNAGTAHGDDRLISRFRTLFRSI
jgi:uncharacterized protein (TIGR03083 family)